MASTAIDTGAMAVTLVGSFVKREFPSEIHRLYRDGHLADPRNGTPAEMDGYSAYLTLKALEIRGQQDFSVEKKALVDAVLRRLDGATPPFAHGARTGSPREIHMRFSAAAVRLLAEGLRDGLLDDRSALDRALLYHLSFRDRVGSETWFLHDSLERAETGIPGLDHGTTSAVWGATTENYLVLNTHLDTLSTALDVLPLVSPETAEAIRPDIRSALACLAFVIAQRPGIWTAIGGLDRFARAIVFQSFRSRWRPIRHVRRLILASIFRVRKQLRARWPTYWMTDGYIERDIRLRGIELEYHLVNVFDLLRLLRKLETGEFSDHEVIAPLEKVATSGLGYAVRSAYRHHILWSTGQSGRAVLVCEAILLALAHRNAEDVPPDWLRLYCDVRRRVAPSSAILGYDPYVVRPASGPCPVDQARDRAVLLDGREIEIDLESNALWWIDGA